MAPYLSVERIEKRYNDTQVLSDINLSVMKGEMICFLGPSGCGKTTLLRIIAGLETQNGGHIMQDGRDISRLPPQLRDYGIVFQSYALFPNLTVYDNVAYGLVNRKMKRDAIHERVHTLLALVGLPDSHRKHPGQLSGGQQQRIALARALATSPGLLLLDEPLSALDARVRVRLRQEIRALQQRLGVTTIMVTHDQEEALSMADRIVVMNQGVIEQIGTPLEIYRQPASPFVADFIGRVNTIPAEVAHDGTLRAGGVGIDCRHGAVRPAQGAAVSVYVRPEDLRIRVAGEAADNVLACRVEKLEFLGAFCRVGFRIDGLDGQEIVADLSYRDVDRTGVCAGARVDLALDREHVRVFPVAQERLQ
ncbi:putative 2-aminoethylphosphonate ABC transporter ATP-binding protein [Burkholderia multivorans]|uniref:putative 2-aminoethylphosphonate ABC transporter ATP-binding protein n=1 Tax=Burkholderia multivorans TaxID=87883 RepID=UPI0009E0E1E6|nr:putative 2-aminoethylphosphonate ABC transporter ATP-binding protein [Burkholderia multivorans]MCA8503148.1 putative 2-aminoethylphosphonate ABC transporter ATP-binding protein [Burkholderia multivorans]MDN8079487.1 putative 2-aminoethylphosphonate ABC transporter ATP-binding protein [Burkholderia multivorans]SAK26399.1 2-aminoethylphosphonate ABC transporter ATP-binding protein [Burkholderia multivorans]SAK30800.1 2-aminoethylphosphonate ABC transporter ATP-binding protein [Burkholderia mul